MDRAVFSSALYNGEMEPDLTINESNVIGGKSRWS